jgi:putative SOS response-associated peptidase YedK
VCGRYFLRLSPERLQQIFGTENARQFTPSDNITPLQKSPLIVQRRMGLARWGLLPDYAQSDDKALCAKLKNARSETITEKQSFAAAWRKGRRCLIPASGFFEWPEEKIKGHPPFKIYIPDEDAIAFAGLWAKRDDLVTFTILTRAASAGLSDIHSRMPVAFRAQQAQRWFEASPDDALRQMNHDSIMDWTIELQGDAPAPVPDLFAA